MRRGRRTGGRRFRRGGCGTSTSATAAATAPACGSGCRGIGRRARCDGERVDATSLQEVNAAAVAAPLRGLAAAESAPAAAPTARASGVGNDGIQARQTRTVLIDGVHGGSATGSGGVVRSPAERGKQVGAAIGRGRHERYRARHAGELRDAPVDAVPHDLHLHRSGRSAASAAACGRVNCGNHCLLLAVDFVGVRRLLRGLQSDRVKLRDGPVQRGHRGRTRAADQQQLFAIRRPAGAARLQEILTADHMLLPARQFFHPDVRTQQFVLPRIGDEFAVGRKLRGGDVAGIALRHDIGLPALHIHHAQLVVASAPHQSSWNPAPR